MELKNTNKKEDYRLEIIKKTRELVSRFGYKKTSTEEIARSLNRTKASLYHYFKSREDILRAAVEYEGSIILDNIKNGLKSETCPEKKIRTFFLIRADNIYKLGKFYKQVREEYFNRYSFIMEALKDYNIEELQILKEIIDEGIERGMFKTPDTTLSAKAIIKSLKAYDFFIFQGEQLKELQSELNEALNIFIKGIKK